MKNLNFKNALIKANSKEKVYNVYKLINPNDNNVFYIGCTSIKLNKRLSIHINDAKHNKSNTNKNNIILDIINSNKIPIIKSIYSCTSEEEAFDKEEELILKYGLDNLTNIALGRKNWLNRHHTDEAIRKMKNAKSNLSNIEKDRLRNLAKGRVHTDYSKRKMSNSHKGKKLSIEARLKIAQSKIGTHLSDETKIKLRKARSKTVYQYGIVKLELEFKLELINIFESARQAQIISNTFREDSISNVCRGTTKLHRGYYWSFSELNELEKDNILNNIFKPKFVYQYCIINNNLMLINIYKELSNNCFKNTEFKTSGIRAAVNNYKGNSYGYVWSIGKELDK